VTESLSGEALGITSSALASLWREWSELWRPKQKLPLADWAEDNLNLTSGAKTGKLRLYVWQREPFNAWTDPRVTTIVLMCGTQMLKTLFMLAATCYQIAEDPGPQLTIFPKEGSAEKFSRERLTPTIKDCAALRGKIADPKSRSGANTLTQKDYPGGPLTLVGAISPDNLASRSNRYLQCDEIDKYPKSAGKEGNPIDIARKRLINWGTRRKVALACSPTEKGRSAIGAEYEQSDQRKPYVPCPRCGHKQILQWERVTWQQNAEGKDDPSTARYACAGMLPSGEDCGALWNDVERLWACDRAEWRAHAPFRGTAGFWISHLYSPWRTLAHIVEEYLDVKDDRNRYKVFVNTTLAELYEEAGETPDYEKLYARAEEYTHGPEAIVPERALFLICPVDVQDNPPRLEYEVQAWGRNRECWSIEYGALQVFAANGQPLPVTSPELWEVKLHELLQREWTHARGQRMPIRLMTIDTGKRPAPVYEFAQKHAQPVYSAAGMAINTWRTVVPIKGNDDALRVISSISKEDAARKRQNVRIITLGTHCLKQEIYDSLRHVVPREDGGPVTGCFHHPRYEKTYFQGCCGEKRITNEDGSIAWERIVNVRNEPLDLKVYGRGGYSIMQADNFTETHWQAWENALGVRGPAQNIAAKPAAPKPAQKENPFTSRGSWLGDRKEWLK
jgi:phage terminase large subunit GpA-like protein